jgi:hypothetical protein
MNLMFTPMRKTNYIPAQFDPGLGLSKNIRNRVTF